MIILGLGTNIGDRLQNLRQTIVHLSQLSDVQIQKISPVYESDALLPPHSEKTWDTPYLNAAVSIETRLTPIQLLEKIKMIEQVMGRTRGQRWAPRVIDIDILTWHDQIIQTERLHIPHPELTKRPFVLWPLADLDPFWRYPIAGVDHGKTAAILTDQWGSRFTGMAPLNTQQINHRIDTPKLIAIINVTPDSFSEHGKNQTPIAAMSAIKQAVEAGADIIDIGAESTRPQANLITLDEEWSRLAPVFEILQSEWETLSFKPKISLDTRHASTAKKALAYGVHIINDVTGGEDPALCRIAAEHDLIYIFMHQLGVPPSKNLILKDQNFIQSLFEWVEKKLQQFHQIGLPKKNLIFDPGIGFGKSSEQSVAIIQQAAHFKKLGLPLLFGHSRKSFYQLFTSTAPEMRDLETAMTSVLLATQHIDYLRIHDVIIHQRLLKIAAELGTIRPYTKPVSHYKQQGAHHEHDLTTQ